MSSDVELVRSFYDDISNMLNAIHPQVEWHEMRGIPYGGVYTSREAVMENVFKHIAADWEGFDATPNMVLGANDGWVAVLGQYHGTYKATGRALECDFAHFFQLQDGRIIKVHQYTDSALWNEVMM